MIQILFALLLAFAQDLSAKSGLPVEQKSVDLQNRAAVEIAVLDDSSSYAGFVDDFLRNNNFASNPVPYVRAWMFKAWAQSSADTKRMGSLQHAMEIALQQKMYVEWAIISASAINNTGDTFQKVQAQYLQSIQTARDLRLPLPLAYILAAYTSFLLDNAHLEQALTTIREADELLHSTTEISLLTYDHVKNDMAIVLSYQGQPERAIQIHREMAERYRPLGIRSALNWVLYNMGSVYLEKKGNEVPAEAVQAFVEAMTLAKAVHDDDVVAYIHYKFSEIYRKQNHLEKALESAHTALNDFIRLEMGSWIPHGNRRLAQTLILMGRFQEALPYLDQAQKLYPAENKAKLSEVELAFAHAYGGLHQYPAAYDHLLRHVEYFTGLSIAREKEEYNRAAATLGLQLETERNQALEEQVNLLKKFRLLAILTASLALLAFGALFMVRRQSREIHRSRQKMHEVLDNIHEGIMIINANLQIVDGYSPFLSRIFPAGGKLEGQNVLDLIFFKGPRHAEAKVMAQEVLQACLGESELSWELNSQHLPSEIEQENRILKLHWQALYTQQRSIRGFLTTVRDITEEKNLERSLRVKSQKVENMREKLGEILGHNPSAIKEFFSQNAASMDDLRKSVLEAHDIPAAFRRLHGWKGAARTLGLKQLASAIHQLESQLDIRSQSVKHVEAARVALRALNEHRTEYAELLAQMTGDPLEAKREDGNLYDYAGTYAQEIKRLLKSKSLAVQGLKIMDNVEAWDRTLLSHIHESLLHAITNSIDHGFIRPMERSKSQPAALIQINAQQTVDRIVVTLQDNGAGIDWSLLRKKADEAGFHPAPGQTLADALFLDGLSTAEATTETSGRGVGLGAIKAICTELKGSVQLQDADGGGTLLTLSLPINPTHSLGVAI